MLPLWAVLAIAGAAKSELVDKKQQERQALLEARKTELSGFTKSGEQGRPIIPTANALGGALQGAGLGLALGDTAESKFQGLFDKSAAAPATEQMANKLIVPQQSQQGGVLGVKPVTQQGSSAASIYEPLTEAQRKEQVLRALGIIK